MSDFTKPYTSATQAGLLLVPTLVVLVAFLYYPAVETLRLSFFQTLLLGTKQQFVGLDNYVALATSAEYQKSILVSFLFAAAVVVGALVASLFISYLLFEVKAGASGYLLAAIWPYALPTAVAGTILLFMLHPTLGIITHYLEALTGLTFDWFTSGPLAFFVLVVVAVWKQLGYNIIFLVAALNNIPETLTESAQLDGVGRLTMLYRVYIPLISPTLTFLVVMNTIYAFFGAFPLVDLMTSGGPNNATNLLIFKLYRDAFEFSSLGQASAESMILFGIVSLLMYVQLRFSDRHAHYGA
ncbi:glycerol--phosphate ABC transporter permease [Haloferax mucosum ATCC BAA-1512]|uniref:Glycerol--phosphate ABC transporter permease n=1 Tax=Haloferax mucosum ATCC BAA-1512 TaxID=662479 RepID=M0IIN8_9EURY|nr:sugar ABC transporter permease [Haloferax mucosum]ELZ95907.1 glycerol--phosphate ABC transporter permease [Haloferax mucosum ATCC BAA-1512]